MAQFPKAYGNGPLVQLFDNVWVTEGLYPAVVGCITQYVKRTMTVVRSGSELCIVNSIRLDEATEAELLRLGTVKHLATLGFLHGIDDPYYVDAFHPTWAPPGADHRHGVTFTDTLGDGKPGPFPCLTAFVLRQLKAGAWEGCLLMDRAGSSGGSSTAPNLLITCDALQNLGLKPGEPPLSALEESFVVRNVARPLKGFKARAMICFAHERYRWEGGDAANDFQHSSPDKGPEPLRDDYKRLFQLDWDALVTGHGPPIKSGAKAEAVESHMAQFGNLLLGLPRLRPIFVPPPLRQQFVIIANTAAGEERGVLAPCCCACCRRQAGAAGGGSVIDEE